MSNRDFRGFLRTQSSLSRARGSLLKPGDVLIVWRRDIELKIIILVVWRSRSRIAPFMNLRVPIAKVQPARAIVITSGKVDEVTTRTALVHGNDKVAVVDALFPFVDQNPGLGRSRLGEITHPSQNLVLVGRIPRPGSIEPIVHRHAAHPTIENTGMLRHALVRRTMPNLQ